MKMSGESRYIDELPFFDEDMPFEGEEQPQAVDQQQPNQNVDNQQPQAAQQQQLNENVANQQPPINVGVGDLRVEVRSLAVPNRPRRVPPTPAPSNYLSRYHDQNMRNVHGRLYSEPIPITRPNGAQGVAMNIEPPNGGDSDYDDSNDSMSSFSPPRPKVAKRDNSYGNDDEGDDKQN